MSDDQSKASSQSVATEPAGKSAGEPAGKKRWLSWAVGWVLLPGTIIGVLFGGGVLVGVHFHDSWLARLIVWFVELF